MAEADPKITVSVAELRANLSRYLKKAKAGASFVVMSRGQSVAVLGPDDDDARAPAPVPAVATASAILPPRVFGQMKGQIWIADDFDNPLPDDILDAFYADNLDFGDRKAGA